MFGKQVANNPKEKQTIENVANMLEYILKSIQEDKFIHFDEKKMRLQLKQYASACNNILSEIKNKLISQQQNGKIVEYDEKKMIQLIRLGFDQNSNWDKSIDDRLSKLNFKKNKQQAINILNHIRTLSKLQSTLKNICKLDSTQKIAPSVQSYVIKVENYQREIGKISKIIFPQNVLQPMQRLKQIDKYITQSKQIADNQDTFFNTIINNLAFEAYDEVAKHSQGLGEKHRTNISRLVDLQQFNRVKSGEIVTQLKSIFINLPMQPQSTKTNLNKIGELTEKLCLFFNRLVQINKNVNEIQKVNPSTKSILDTYLQAIVKLQKDHQNISRQCSQLRLDLNQKIQQNSKLSSFPKQCYRYLGSSKKTLNFAINQTQEMIDRIKSLVSVEKQYQKLNIQCVEKEEKIKDYLKTNNNKSPAKLNQPLAKNDKFQLDKKYKQLEQDYTLKEIELSNLQDKIVEIAGHKKGLQMKTIIPTKQLEIYAFLEQISKKLKRIDELERINRAYELERNSLKQQQGGNNKILMNQNKDLKRQIDQLNKEVRGYQSLNNSTSALEKDNAHLKQQLLRRQQQIKKCKETSSSIEKECGRLLNEAQASKQSLSKLQLQKQNCYNARFQQKQAITKLQAQNQTLFGIIQTKKKEIQDLSKAKKTEEIEVLGEQQQKENAVKSQNQILLAKLNDQIQQLSKDKKQLSQRIDQRTKYLEKIARRILTLIDYQPAAKESMILLSSQESNSHSINFGTKVNFQDQNNNTFQEESNLYYNLAKIQKRIEQEISLRKNKEEDVKHKVQQIQGQLKQISKLKGQRNKLKEEKQKLETTNQQLEEQIKRLKEKQESRGNIEKEQEEKQQVIKQGEVRIVQKEQIQIMKNEEQNSLSNQQNKRSNILHMYPKTMQFKIEPSQPNDLKEKNIEFKEKLFLLFEQIKKQKVYLNQMKQSLDKAKQQFIQQTMKLEQDLKPVLSTFAQNTNNTIQQIKVSNKLAIEAADKKYKKKMKQLEQQLKQSFQQENKLTILQRQSAEMESAQLKQKLLEMHKMEEKIKELEAELANCQIKQSIDKQGYDEVKSLTDKLKNSKQKQKQLQREIQLKDKQLNLKNEQLGKITKQYADFKEKTTKIVHKIYQFEKQKITLPHKPQELLKNQEHECKIEVLLKYHGFINNKIEPNLSFILHLSKLFQGKLMENEIHHKFTILSHLSKITTSPLIKTQLLYKYDTINKQSFHRYIDNHSNILCITKTARGIFLAGYYSGVYACIPNKPMSDPGLIMNLNNNQSYTLKVPQVKQTSVIKSMIYDDYYLIFGNAEFRIRSQENLIFSNFGVMGGYFNNRGHKIDKFLCEGNERETLMQSYEIYELCFAQEERERNQ